MVKYRSSNNLGGLTMLNKIRVLIGDDSVEYGVACANTLRNTGWYVITRAKDGAKILDSIRNDVPDIVVLDAVLPNIDAIEVIKRSSELQHKPKFIVTSPYDNPFVEKQVAAMKDYCATKKLFNKISLKAVPGALKGLGFVFASIAGYKIGMATANAVLGEQKTN